MFPICIITWNVELYWHNIRPDTTLLKESFCIWWFVSKVRQKFVAVILIYAKQLRQIQCLWSNHIYRIICLISKGWVMTTYACKDCRRWHCAVDFVVVDIVAADIVVVTLLQLTLLLLTLLKLLLTLLLLTFCCWHFCCWHCCRWQFCCWHYCCWHCCSRHCCGDIVTVETFTIRWQLSQSGI